MNKVISIHLHGVAFQLEEAGYEALRAYLDKAERQLSANPDRSEILADIEQATADKFRALLSAGRNVVLTAEVESVIKEMGPVTDDTAAEAASSKAEANASSGPSSTTTAGAPPLPQPKRLYRLKDGAMLAGVCNGLAAYLGIDVTLLRLVVAVLIFFSFGTVAIAYLVCILIIPKAETPEEKAAAAGFAPTAQEFIRRAKEGYYEGFKTMGDREAHRAWKRKFKYEMRDWKQRLQREYRGYNWWSPGAPPVPPVPPVSPTGAVPPLAPPESFPVAMPILSFLKTVLVFIAWFVIISLIATGRILGVALPGGLPVWAGIVLTILAYKVVIAPIKALRRSYYYRYNGWPAPWNPAAEILGTLLTIAILAGFIWLADLLFPSFHQALLNIPIFLQNASEAAHQWWTQR